MNQNFRPGNVIQGQPMPTVSASYTLTANHQILQVQDFSTVYISSDNATPANRIFTISNGQLDGQELTIVYTGSSGACQLLKTGNIVSSGTWQPGQYDTIQFIWNQGGLKWCQVSGAESSSSGFDPHITNPQNGDILDYQASTGFWTNNQMSGDGTLAYPATLSVTKLHGATPTDILVADSSGNMQQVIMSGDGTISSAGALSIGALHGATPTDILVADGSGNMQKVLMSGDGIISSAGAISIAALHGASSGQILVANGGGNMTQVTMHGDATIDSTGLVTVAGGGISYFTSRVKLTNDQVLSMDPGTGNVTFDLVAAPGSGNLLIPVSFQMEWNGVAGLTTTFAGFWITYNGAWKTTSTAIQGLGGTNFISQGNTQFRTFTPYGYDGSQFANTGGGSGFQTIDHTTSAVNQSIVFWCSGVLGGAGDPANYLTILTTYYVVTYPL